MELIRFFFVSAVGVAIDISIAYTIATLFGTPLWIAAAIGFLVAAVGNYILHESWTFSHATSRLSAKRAVYYIATSVVTLSSRLLVVAWLSDWISRDLTLLILIGGAAVSFLVNFIISKFLVFSRRAENKGNPK